MPRASLPDIRLPIETVALQPGARIDPCVLRGFGIGSSLGRPAGESRGKRMRLMLTFRIPAEKGNALAPGGSLGEGER